MNSATDIDMQCVYHQVTCDNSSSQRYKSMYALSVESQCIAKQYDQIKA